MGERAVSTMSTLAAQTFNSISFYKGYLPAKEAQLAQAYIILAFPLDATTQLIGSRPLTSQTPSKAAHSGALSFPSTPQNGPFSTTPLLQPSQLTTGLPEKLSLDRSTAKNIVGTNSVYTESLSATPSSSIEQSYSFYIVSKRDVLPPPIRFYVSPRRVHRCFLGCEILNCACDRVHIRPAARRQKVDSRGRCDITVAYFGSHIRVPASQIVPTAGYYFAIGLRDASIIRAAIPSMCRFNKACRNGDCCLYIHANDFSPSQRLLTADVSLRVWTGSFLDITYTVDEQDAFFSFLDRKGVRNVGDLQVLGIPAFESLAESIPPKWAEAFLCLSVLRIYSTKLPLAAVLATFPHISAPVELPAGLEFVRELLNLSAREFYRLNLPPFIMDACSMIRTRCETDDSFNIIDLKKEEKVSFFAKVTSHIDSFRLFHAHCSWRKNDSTRPIVTSMLTYINANYCSCSQGAVTVSAEKEMLQVEFDEGVTGSLGVPPGSWCSCPRYGVIAVNYELSTPSGSRCSEQNAMGKLASMGVPTWAVREVFVHGENTKKEANPLFPCGVCENMLQKVTKDVASHYGGQLTLYMFDATVPRKIVYLPVPEISNRDSANFKRFVAQDLREE